MNNQLDKAVDVLKNDGVIIFPTDTAYAIGCSIESHTAVERLFSIRKRSVKKPTPVLVDTVKMAQHYLEPIPKKVIDDLIEPYWPGGLTIVMKCNVDEVHQFIRGGTDSLGVRIPNNKTARYLIRNLGCPIVGTSANYPGEQTPFNFLQLDKILVESVDMVVEEDIKSSSSSTVIDCTTDEWKILRQGAVKVSL